VSGKDSKAKRVKRSPGKYLVGYQERREAGLCVRGCGRQAIRSRTMCIRCKAKHKAYLQHWRKAQREAREADL
jgi:hypothetical protein